MYGTAATAVLPGAVRVLTCLKKNNDLMSHDYERSGRSYSAEPRAYIYNINKPSSALPVFHLGGGRLKNGGREDTNQHDGRTCHRRGGSASGALWEGRAKVPASISYGIVLLS